VQAISEATFLSQIGNNYNGCQKNISNALKEKENGCQENISNALQEKESKRKEKKNRTRNAHYLLTA
jgi:hypothetical protein